MAGLGDSLLTFPIIEIFKNKGFEITVWGNTEYFSLAKIAGICKEITIYEPKKHFPFSVILSKERSVFRHLKNAIFIDPIPKEGKWVVHYYLEQLNLLEEKFSKTLKIDLREEKIPHLCIIHPGSGSKKKNPSLDFFIDLQNLIQSKGYNTLFVLGPAEKELSYVLKNYQFFDNILDLAKTLMKASLYVGLDSGVSHLSSYLGIPSVIIYGPTDPKIWHPLGENFWTLRDEKCPPCFPLSCKDKKCLSKDFLIPQIEVLLDKNIKELKISQT